MNVFRLLAVSSAAPLLFAAGSAQAVNVETSGGLTAKSDDGRFEGQLGGRVHLDGAFYDDDKTQVGANDNGAYFRRLRLDFKGKLFNAWGAKLQFDFGNEALDVKDAFISYTDKSDTLVSELQIGQYKQPMGLEELTSSNYLTFMERSAPVTGIIPGHKIGLAYSGQTSQVLGKVSLYTGSNTDTTNPSSGAGLGARLTFTPMKSNNGVLYLGLSAAGERDILQCGSKAVVASCAKSVGQENLKSLSSSRWGTRHGTKFAVAKLDDGKYDTVRAGVEAAIVQGAWYAQAEYLYADLKGEANFDAQFSGYYLTTGYFLTGESRPYKAAEGTFDRIKPHGSMGAWEVAARYASYRGESTKQANTGQVDDITLGLNWYVNPQVRFMLDYAYANPNKTVAATGGNPQALMMRAQVDF